MQDDAGKTPPPCHADTDGECNWKECPQNVEYKQYCPLAKAWEEHQKKLDPDWSPRW